MRNKFLLWLNCLLSVTFCLWANENDVDFYKKPSVGINPFHIKDWSTEQVFKDVFKSAREWISQRHGSEWGKGPKLSLDTHGWVKTLDKDCYAETLLCTISHKKGEAAKYPSGIYKVTYEGEGVLDFSGAAKILEHDLEQGEMTLNVNPKLGAIHCKIMKTDAKNHLRNIRVYIPGETKSSVAKNPWRTGFIERWQGMKVIRYMDMLSINNNPLKTWDERPLLDDAIYSTKKGMPLELVVDLSNRINANPWVCIPSMADDVYVQNLAIFLKKHLNPALIPLIEYSNETWNGMFKQSKHCSSEGLRLKLADKPWEAGWFYTTHRSLEIFNIMDGIYENENSYVKVLSGQAANSWLNQKLLSYKQAYKAIDAFAIAPYITCNIGSPKIKISEFKSKNLDEWMNYMEHVALPESIEHIQHNQKMASDLGVTLIAYEGGQHLSLIGKALEVKQFEHNIIEASGHDRMGVIYDQYIKAWEESGAGLFCFWGTMGEWGKYGGWGLTQYMNSPPSPKYRSVIQWTQRLGYPTKIQESGL